MTFHHGITITEYRKLKRMTQAQLAAKWPNDNGGEGVNTRYVQDVEYGVKQIDSMKTLRKLASILDIPLWKFGLSDYDPFSEQGMCTPEKDASFDVTISTMSTLIEYTWRARLVEPLPLIERFVHSLAKRSSTLKEQWPSSYVAHPDFLRMHAQVERLQGITIQNKNGHEQALTIYYAMLKTAEQLEEPVILCLAYTRIGAQFLKLKRVADAIEAMEKARDYTFHTSKNLAAVTHGFLARVYATDGDKKRFERAIDTALILSEHIPNESIDTTDWVYLGKTAIIEEKSNGYILLKDGKNAHSVLPLLEEQTERENSHYMRLWLPLEYAQIYMLSGEPEKSIEKLLDYRRLCMPRQTPAMLAHVRNHLMQMEEAGYGDVQAVRDFQAELRTVQP